VQDGDTQELVKFGPYCSIDEVIILEDGAPKEVGIAPKEKLNINPAFCADVELKSFPPIFSTLGSPAEDESQCKKRNGIMKGGYESPRSEPLYDDVYPDKQDDKYKGGGDMPGKCYCDVEKGIRLNYQFETCRYNKVYSPFKDFAGLVSQHKLKWDASPDNYRKATELCTKYKSSFPSTELPAPAIIQKGLKK